MRIYLAGYYNGKASAYAIEQGAYDWFLESYHYIQRESILDSIRRDKRSIFLDSGAFSAFTKGVEIKLEDYAAFIHKNKDIIHLAANLDDLHKREELTWKNQKALESMGVKPVPVFHTREDPKWLLKYMDAGYDYIALGGMVPESKPWLMKWLDDIWGTYLTDKNGRAKIKVHGFGLTTFDLMFRYPWYSVDSTSWVLTGRFGSIYYLDRERDTPVKIFISDQSPSRKDWDRHYDSMSSIHRAKLDSEIRKRGFDPEELRSIYWKRDLFNIATFKEMTDRKLDIKFFKHKGLF